MEDGAGGSEGRGSVQGDTVECREEHDGVWRIRARVDRRERGMQCGGERACVCFVESDREETRERDELRVAG